MRPIKKIHDQTLLEMADRGDQQKDIAAFFGVSEAAISKRLKRLRHQQETAACMETLTEKQQTFVAEICGGKSHSDAALAAFDCTPSTAPSIARNLLSDVKISTAIMVLMEESGLTRKHLVRTLKRHVDSADGQVSLRATVEGFKLFDSYPASKNVNVNVDISPIDLSAYRM